jgi:hypothetical protein
MADDDESERLFRNLSPGEREVLRTRFGVDPARDVTPTQETKRSRYRLKAFALTAVFTVCWFIAGMDADALSDPLHGLLVVGIAGLSSSLLIFIRCERCRSSLYYCARGARVPWKLSFLWAKRCPCCDLDRV